FICSCCFIKSFKRISAKSSWDVVVHPNHSQNLDGNGLAESFTNNVVPFSNRMVRFSRFHASAWRSVHTIRRLIAAPSIQAVSLIFVKRTHTGFESLFGCKQKVRPDATNSK